MVQNGDKNAFGILVERYEPKLSRYANKFLYNYEDRQDAVQDVFIKTYQNIQSFRSGERFSPWIYRIAHNTYINVIKKNGREKVSSFDSDTLFSFNIKDENIEDLREQSEEREVLEQSLMKIDTKYREILVLFYFEEKSYEEISEILKIPKATVGVRLKRGRQQMQKHYKSINTEEGMLTKTI